MTTTQAREGVPCTCPEPGARRERICRKCYPTPAAFLDVAVAANARPSRVPVNGEGFATGHDRHMVEVPFPNGMRLTIVREDEYDAVTVWSEDREGVFTAAYVSPHLPAVSPVGTQKPSGFGVDNENHEALREKVADARLRLLGLVSTSYEGEVHSALDQILAALQSGGEGG